MHAHTPAGQAPTSGGTATGSVVGSSSRDCRSGPGALHSGDQAGAAAAGEARCPRAVVAHSVAGSLSEAVGVVARRGLEGEGRPCSTDEGAVWDGCWVWGGLERKGGGIWLCCTPVAGALQHAAEVHQ